MVEYERIEEPYEFEEIAGLFMADVVGLSKDYPDLLVDAENKTLRDLEANSWAIKKSAQLNKPEMNRKAFFRGLKLDVKSADEAVVAISIHGAKKKMVREFRSLVAKSAQHFQGILMNVEEFKDFDGPDDENRFFTCLIYNFK